MAKGDLSDSGKVGRKALEERLARRNELADMGWMLNNSQGRRFLWRMMKATRMFEECMTGNNTTFYNLGARSVGLPILLDTQKFPDLYLLMVKENNPIEEPTKVPDEKETEET